MSEEFLAYAEKEREAVGSAFTEPLWARAVQRVDQLALLYACSRDYANPVIDAEAVEWARDVLVYLTAWVAWAAERHVGENETESATKRTLRLIEEAGADGITATQLCLATQWLRGRARERNDLVSELISGGQVYRAERKGRTKPTMVYVHRKHVPAADR